MITSRERAVTVLRIDSKRAFPAPPSLTMLASVDPHGRPTTRQQPFPSRVILILTPAFLTTGGDLVRLIAVGTAGAVLGDHVPYLAGRLAGTRLLELHCRVTLASDRCSCGHITYQRSLAFDVGTTLDTSVCILVGSLIGERAIVFLTIDRRRWLFVGRVVIGVATLLGYRLWRWWHYGRARASRIARAGAPRLAERAGAGNDARRGGER